MNSELLVTVIILFVGALLSAEYIWLYLVANRQEDNLRRSGRHKREICAMFESAMYSPTESALEYALDELCNYVNGDYERFNIAACRLLDIKRRLEDLPERRRKIVYMIEERLDPIAAYQKYFDEGGDYLKGYICRRLADFRSYSSAGRIRSCVDSKNKTLRYNGAMALAVLGDEEYTVKYLKMCENNRKYSYRIIVELLHLYSGDKAKLSREVFENCSEYMKASIIKGISGDKLTELADVYIRGVTSANPQVRIACVKALAEIAAPEHEHMLITALNDKNWVVRAAAVRGLQRIKTDTSLAAIERAVGDDEWWVRQVAAKALIEVDSTLEHVEAVLQGYDRYAADAMKNSLYKIIDMDGGAEK